MLPSSQMAIQLTLLLISCSLYSMYSSSSSSSSASSSSSSFSTSSSYLALLVLVISTGLSLLFTNLRQMIRARSHRGKPHPSMEDQAVHQEEESIIVPQDEVADDAPEDLTGSLSESSDSPVSEECTEEGSVSDDGDDDDDESLIEISLVDGHYLGQEKKKCAWKEQDLLSEFLPDLLLDKRDFMDILSEIGEEDNLIEIDIARGSIKCSSFGIKA
ncbi:uncharacterized protein [Oryza sativa Japonica Group]|uniref:Expressed protein n=2 Tax=Oryza sativa subsp. japonica TaxID=39947 RepID=Q2QQC6_ORYSJ|nr:uncharacterized protein LOC4352267 [Oryza sativa Japonica Group]ABA98606.1 expressed protein [Oryza sativa Japonica Group]BAF29834.1 Os12g0498900 [Oryza sativa Japonica Group]BAG93557.1 unnamed protein product [Oryza sativa Japonica Group]BAT17239.1 Os12g0498900 [Oryza sativa Japonica Group]|eukprot:NP_001066815.1 Os12g0498900 [Oryza sativa Japonica Group]